MGTIYDPTPELNIKLRLDMSLTLILALVLNPTSPQAHTLNAALSATLCDLNVSPFIARMDGMLRNRRWIDELYDGERRKKFLEHGADCHLKPYVHHIHRAHESWGLLSALRTFAAGRLGIVL